MNIFRRVRLWFREDPIHTILEDFGGDLLVNCIRGLVRIESGYVYDRATKAYDTTHSEVWTAFALHDWCCDELALGRAVEDINGTPIITKQEEADDELMLQMLRAASAVYCRLLKTPGDRARALLEARDIVRRALVYRRGVGAWDGIARALGVRV